MPFAGGAETPIPAPGKPQAANWSDSVTLAVSTPSSTGLHLAQIDARTGAQRNAMDLADSAVVYASPLADGWVWIPASGDRIMVRRGGQTRAYAEPAWYAFLFQVVVDPTGRRAFYQGTDRTGDSIGVGAVSLDDGAMAQWTAMPSILGHLTPLADGSVLLENSPSALSIALLKLTGPGQVQRMGVIPRQLRAASASADLKLGTAQERDYRADAWISKVVKQ
jgi:hypothetical protein